MAPPLDSPLVCPTLIGRETDLALLLRLAERAASVQGTTALIAGEAGIGKSRLVAEFKRRLLARRAGGGQPTPRILAGHCFEHDRARSYAPLRDLLHSFFALCSPGELADYPRFDAPALLKLLPELAAVIPEVDARTGDLEGDQQRLFHALALLFAHLATQHPLVVVIEDLHWSDDASLAFLNYFARRIPSLRLLLVATYRDGEVGPGLAGLLGELNRERLATDSFLVPLTRAEVDSMERAIFGLTRSVHTDFLETLYLLTEGNPFFLEEVLKSLVTAGEIFYADGAWDRKPLELLRLPRSIQLTVQRRLDGLSEAGRELLSLASVVGRRFDFTLLQALTGRNETTLIHLMKELIKAQLVTEEAADQFVFRHALTRQAVYSDLLARERRTLHRAVAEELERRAAGAPDPPLADLSYHYMAAGAWERVLAIAPRAGQQAQDLYAPHAAIEHYSRALAAAERLGVPLPWEAARARGQCYETAGDFAAARADYTRVLEYARATGERAIECQALVDLGWLATTKDYTQAGEYYRAALALARESAASAPLAAALLRAANLFVNLEDPDRAHELLREALAMYQTLGDRRGQVAALDLLGITTYLSGDLFAGAEIYARAIALARELDQRQSLAASLTMAATRGGAAFFATLVWPVVDPAIILSESEEALALARTIGWRAGEAAALDFLAYILMPRGEYARALEAALAARALTDELGHRVWGANANNALTALYTELLAFERARACGERALELARESGSSFVTHLATSLLAAALIGAGALDRAEALLATAPIPASPPRTAGLRLIWAARAELALAHGDALTALRLVDELIAVTANLESGLVVCSLWRLRGEALLALGRVEQAATTFLAGRATAATAGLRPSLWRFDLALGRARAARGRRDDAARHFAAARRTVEELAASIPDEELRAGFRRQVAALFPRAAVPTRLRAAKWEYGGLTARERAVAALIAQGKSNRAVADELVLSERTIEKHVENILGKLAFTSRAQIAVWAAERGLRPTRREA